MAINQVVLMGYHGCESQITKKSNSKTITIVSESFVRILRFCLLLLHKNADKRVEKVSKRAFYH